MSALLPSPQQTSFHGEKQKKRGGLARMCQNWDPASETHRWIPHALLPMEPGPASPERAPSKKDSPSGLPKNSVVPVGFPLTNPRKGTISQNQPKGRGWPGPTHQSAKDEIPRGWLHLTIQIDLSFGAPRFRLVAVATRAS